MYHQFTHTPQDMAQDFQTLSKANAFICMINEFTRTYTHTCKPQDMAQDFKTLSKANVAAVTPLGEYVLDKHVLA